MKIDHAFQVTDRSVIITMDDGVTNIYVNVSPSGKMVDVGFGNIATGDTRNWGYVRDGEP